MHNVVPIKWGIITFIKEDIRSNIFSSILLIVLGRSLIIYLITTLTQAHWYLKFMIFFISILKLKIKYLFKKTDYRSVLIADNTGLKTKHVGVRYIMVLLQQNAVFMYLSKTTYLNDMHEIKSVSEKLLNMQFGLW